MKFDLYRLGSREFENLSQSIAVAELGPDVAVYGMGSDGGREATQNEVNGEGPYTVLQAKYKEVSSSAQAEATWLIKEIRKEFKEWRESEKRERSPECFILATNVTLSATPRTGGMDRVSKVMKEECDELGISQWIIWHADNVCRFLEAHPGIRTSYAAWILPGDILSLIYQDVARRNSGTANAIRSYIPKELLNDRFANLDQAGSADDRTVPLADVFFDLPIGVSQDRYASADGARCLDTLIAACDVRHSAEVLDSPEAGPAANRFVLVGGPGQGKSTVSQFLCQLYRAQLVKDTFSMRNAEVRAAVTQINEQAAKDGLLPKARRWPINIPLTRLADELAQGKCSNLFDYIGQRVSEASASLVTATDMRDWLKCFPWLVVLDGLDEVPSSSNRGQVLSQISAFQLEADELNGDVVLVATTRPQGYTDDFSPKHYVHYYLTALNTSSALGYGKKLADARHGNSSERVNRLMGRLTQAAGEPSTAHLMSTPLQVTIMAVLLDRVGKAPKDRFTLFADYYRVIFERELEKEGAASNLLREHKTDIDSIHADVGLLLQTRSERSGETESRITVDELDTIIRDRLATEGHTGEGLDTLTSSIRRAATHRLVFLVPSRDGEVSFEIRSLQEFWAADALLSCNEGEIGPRLGSMAVSSHWRNVLLFALGSIFATRRNNLRDSVIALVSELNAHSEDFGIMPRRILTGSRLAVEILNDGMVRAPKYEAILVEESLKLLSLPYSNHVSLLAGCISDRGMNIARDHIRLATSSDRDVSESMLAFLAERAAHNDEWARAQLVDSYERLDSKSAERLFILAVGREMPALLHVASASLADPAQTIRLVQRSHILSAGGYSHLMEPKGCSSAPSWLPAVVNLFSRTQSSKMRIAMRLGPMAAYLTSVRHFPDELAECVSSGFPSDHWLTAVSDFCSSPSSASLSVIVRRLGPHSDGFEEIASSLPWIIYYGVQLYREIGDSAVGMIEDGYIGDFPDWVAAEAQWKNSSGGGVVNQDFEKWRTRREGFMPIPACRLTLMRNSSAYVDEIEDLVSVCAEIEDARQRSDISESLLRVAFQMRNEVSKERLMAVIRQLCDMHFERPGGFFNGSWLSDVDVDSDWIELLDHVGQRVALGNTWIPYPQVDLLMAWSRDFSRVGLPRLVVAQGSSPARSRQAIRHVLAEWERVRDQFDVDNASHRMMCIISGMLAAPHDMEDAELRFAHLKSSIEIDGVNVGFLSELLELNCDEPSRHLILSLADRLRINESERQALYERMVRLQSSALTDIEYQRMRPC
ncbi:NACHT domain-containing protein [Streptomyces sp. LARHCF252]